jgi:hypothetical protein
MTNGGIMLRGGLKRKSENFDMKIGAEKMKSEEKSQMNASQQWALKKSTLQELGSKIKKFTGGVKVDLEGLTLISPIENECVNYTAYSTDYTVIMHFSDNIKDRLIR